MAADRQLTSFAPYIAPDWQYQSNCGLYVHRGWVYVVGAMAAGLLYDTTTGGSVTYMGNATVLTGLPPELRPPSPTAAPLLIDPTGSTSEYASNSTTRLGPFIASTVYPDGSWTIDGGNPFTGDSVDDPLNGSLIYLILSAARWPTAQTTPDNYAPASVRPFVLSDNGWDAGTATYAAHDARLHLDGSLVVTGANPSTLRVLDHMGEIEPYFGIFTPDLTGLVDRTALALPDGRPASVNRSVNRADPGVPASVALAIDETAEYALRDVFYDQSPTGYLRRGHNFDTTGLHVGAGDVDLDLIGMVASPVDGPTLGDTEWTGNNISMKFEVGNADGLGTTMTNVTGPSQLALLVGLGGATVYYKVVVIYDPTNPTAGVVGALYRVQYARYGSVQTEIGGAVLGGYDAVTNAISGRISLTISAEPISSLVYSGTDPLTYGIVYINLGVDSSHVQTFYDIPPGPTGATPLGDMARAIPTFVNSYDGYSINAIGQHIFELGSGDTLDLTGVGWPLAFTPVSLAPPKVPTNLSAGPSSVGPLRGKRNLGGTAQRKLTSQERYTVANLVYLAVSVGVVGENAAIAGAIGMAESGGDPQNIGYNPGPPASRDRGLWQINDYYHPDVSDQCAFDPTCNAHAMYAISSGGTNWTPWATYNNGLHLPFMAAAEAALSAMTDTPPAAESATSGASGVASAGPRRHDGS